ncbi:MAG: ribbon-helix-helix protein, CopG family [Solirubrobacterales bacterium]|nr:ribbon-helix-helix protein, CopG family [Solirubrobacterales bacterium]
MSARAQTLVQLTEALVDLLDRRAAARGVSRSALIRELLEQALREDRSAEVSDRMIDGYRRVPQRTADDVWGDLDAWTETNTRRNLAALADEETQSW